MGRKRPNAVAGSSQGTPTLTQISSRPWKIKKSETSDCLKTQRRRSCSRSKQSHLIQSTIDFYLWGGNPKLRKTFFGPCSVEDEQEAAVATSLACCACKCSSLGALCDSCGDATCRSCLHQCNACGAHHCTSCTSDAQLDANTREFCPSCYRPQRGGKDNDNMDLCKDLI
jgi:hypothetical protein